MWLPVFVIFPALSVWESSMDHSSFFELFCFGSRRALPPSSSSHLRDFFGLIFSEGHTMAPLSTTIDWFLGIPLWWLLIGYCLFWLIPNARWFSVIQLWGGRTLDDQGSPLQCQVSFFNTPLLKIPLNSNDTTEVIMFLPRSPSWLAICIPRLDACNIFPTTPAFTFYPLLLSRRRLICRHFPLRICIWIFFFATPKM